MITIELSGFDISGVMVIKIHDFTQASDVVELVQG